MEVLVEVCSPQRELGTQKLGAENRELRTINKKASQTFQFRTPRQPSPRTAKPQLILGPPSECVNVTSVLHSFLPVTLRNDYRGNRAMRSNTSAATGYCVENK